MRAMMIGGAALVVGMVGLARAADTITVKPDDIIAGRQAAYDLQGGALAAMKGAIDAGAPVKPLTDAAKGMVSWGHAMTGMFPDGTQTGRDTKAKAEIWSDRAGFEKAAADFVAASTKLVALAEADDKAGFAAQFKEVGAACGGCHRPYRARS